VPALALLASVGVMELEGATVGRTRATARCVWIPALAISSAFTLLYGVERCVADHNYSGLANLAYGDVPGAEREFDTARFLSPRNPVSRLGSGVALVTQGRNAEATAALEALIRDFPDYAMGHFALANVLAKEGRRGEALAQYLTAHRLDPEDATIKSGLDSALAGRR
jgi:cytochrome c-type biogenesis protein CcmH/NrfG